MRLDGERQLQAPRSRVWALLQDHDALARIVPGTASFSPAGDRRATFAVTGGAAGAHGTYRGTVEVASADAPEQAELHVRAAGEPGEVAADVTLRLDAAADDRTTLRHMVDATLRGALTSLGAQLLDHAASRFVEGCLDGLEAALEEPAGPEQTPVADAAHSPGLPAGPARVGARAAAATRSLTGAALGAAAGIGGLVVARRALRDRRRRSDR